MLGTSEVSSEFFLNVFELLLATWKVDPHHPALTILGANGILSAILSTQGMTGIEFLEPFTQEDLRCQTLRGALTAGPFKKSVPGFIPTC
jgi:hypothetical protein